MLGVEFARAGMETAKRGAAHVRVPMRTQLADIRRYPWRGRVDVVFSITALNNLPPRSRAYRFAHLRSAATPGRFHALNAFVSAPDLAPAPDLDHWETRPMGQMATRWAFGPEGYASGH